MVTGPAGSDDQERHDLVASLLAGPVTLTRDEALAVATVRMGDSQRALDGAWTAMLVAIGAALAVQLTRPLADEAGPTRFGELLLVMVASVGVLLALRHRPDRRQVGIVLAVLLAGAAALRLPPFPDGSQSAVLVLLHAPAVAWAVLSLLRRGVGRTGTSRPLPRRLDHARLTGEVAVLMVLFALGGGALLALTLTLLEPVGVDADALAGWALPSGAAGALVIATWLADGGWQGTTRIAPLMAAVFTPLLAATLAAVTLMHALAGRSGGFDRELLVVFDLLLLLVVALVVLGAAVRRSDRPAGASGAVLLVMVVAAVALDALVLGAMLGRVGELGLTPNRVAALGLNLVLLVNLVGSAFVCARAIVRSEALDALARWQAWNLPALVVWAALVAVVLPALFSFA